LIVPAFIPSSLHEIVEYFPSLMEWQITAGVWGWGLLILTIMLKIALPILRQPHPESSHAVDATSSAMNAVPTALAETHHS
jgi:molybdopterin-containing oxidoreductase family membrane subunit